MNEGMNVDNKEIIKEIEELKETSKMYREKIERECPDEERQRLYPWCDFSEKAKDCDKKVSILSELLLLRSGKAEIIKEFGNELISYFSDWQLSTAAFIVRDRNPEQEKEYAMIEESIKAIREFTEQKVEKCLEDSEKQRK
mgnify:CR=1 FL=1